MKVLGKGQEECDVKKTLDNEDIIWVGDVSVLPYLKERGCLPAS